jgi:hypothetical protein
VDWRWRRAMGTGAGRSIQVIPQARTTRGGEPIWVSPDATSGICLISMAWRNIPTFKTIFRVNDFE